MDKIPSPAGLRGLFHEAYHWLCRSRKKHPPDADIWDFRRSWAAKAEAIMEAFRRGTYRFGPQKKVTLRGRKTVALWSSADALVIKVLTRILQARLQPILSPACYHLKGHGGLKGAVREVLKVLPRYRLFWWAVFVPMKWQRNWSKRTRLTTFP